ncbi:mitogen-activated protein kinase 7-like [Salarias fasciatus]|uniref:mitogen-activated protein kinase 7-like n=1 Tax=Salarias fasciatus TaxID=181472 RepID=UPI0011770C94|nr:mitogen-activated protein kinase 7-like [Salarias fasciatus]
MERKKKEEEEKRRAREEERRREEERAAQANRSDEDKQKMRGALASQPEAALSLKLSPPPSSSLAHPPAPHRPPLLTPGTAAQTVTQSHPAPSSHKSNSVNLHERQGQPSLIKESSLSNSVVPDKKLSVPQTAVPPHSGLTIPPSAQDKVITLDVLKLVPPPQRLSDAENPLWKALEALSGKDTPEKISAKEVIAPLCRG